MPYIDVNPSLDHVNALDPNDPNNIIILHPRTPIDLATAFARGLPRNRIILILKDTDSNLSSAVARVLPYDVVLVLEPTMGPAEGQAIVRNLNSLSLLALSIAMPLKVRLAILRALPTPCRVHLDQEIQPTEIPDTLRAIPQEALVRVPKGTSLSAVSAVAQNLKKGQFISFESDCSESLMLTAVRNLATFRAMMFHTGMSFTVIENLRPNRALFIPYGVTESLAREITRHIPAEAVTFIIPRHPEGTIRAIAAELKPGAKLQLHDDLPLEKILIACRSLVAGTILKLAACLTLKNYLQIARALNPGVHVELDNGLSLEVRTTFITDWYAIRETYQLSLFPAVARQDSSHTINQRERTSVDAFIGYELSEHGTFYAGFNALEDDIKITLLDYLIQKNTISDFPSDPILENIATELDGGVALFNDLNRSIKKIVPSADIPNDIMEEIKAKIVLNLENLQKVVENKITYSWGIS